MTARPGQGFFDTQGPWLSLSLVWCLWTSSSVAVILVQSEELDRCVWTHLVWRIYFSVVRKRAVFEPNIDVVYVVYHCCYLASFISGHSSPWRSCEETLSSILVSKNTKRITGKETRGIERHLSQSISFGRVWCTIIVKPGQNWQKVHYSFQHYHVSLLPVFLPSTLELFFFYPCALHLMNQRPRFALLSFCSQTFRFLRKVKHIFKNTKCPPWC